MDLDLTLRHYYLISVAIICIALAVFAWRFEGRRPRAREIVVIAVLVALAVAGRAAFFMVPQFKPVAALVIISGVALGANTGFLVGVLSGFVSNFVFGQGPWTPFQMIAFGLLGLLAGLIFSRYGAAGDDASPEWAGVVSATDADVAAIPGDLLAPALARKRFQRVRLAWLCVFGGLVTFCVYGPIVDAAAMLIFPQELSKQAVLLTLASGVPFNLIHAVSTVIFLLILARPMLEKLDRVKQKYGLLRN
jgi:energy-coupling factor transport system substrate-specific component